MSRLGKLIRNETKEVEICGETFTLSALNGTQWDVMREVMSTIDTLQTSGSIGELNADAIYNCVYHSLKVEDSTITLKEVKSVLLPTKAISLCMDVLELSGIVDNDNSSE